MLLEYVEIDTSDSRNVFVMESALEQKLQWSLVAISNFLSSLMIMIILCNILNKNCLPFVVVSNLIYLGKIASPVEKIFGVGSDTEHSFNKKQNLTKTFFFSIIFNSLHRMKTIIPIYFTCLVATSRNSIKIFGFYSVFSLFTRPLIVR